MATAAVVAEASAAPATRWLLDGLNIAYWGGNPPSLRAPLALLAELLRQGCEAQLFFDASAPYRLADEAEVYASLREHPEHFCEVPSGRSADGALLRAARASGACIVSRDHYRDHRRRYRKLIDDPTRLLSGFVKENLLHLPTAGMQVPLAPSATEAWQMLLTLLARPTKCLA